jgi:phosphoadenosine phosphosulfate reductase
MQLKIDYETSSIKDKEEISIDRIKQFEPEEGYYLAFSGGKDSIVIEKLCELAKVKYTANYAHTTVDPPELIYFIRENYPNVNIIKPELSMWRLIEKKKMPPTRRVRYCCEVLKEEGGQGRFVITGVRHEESSARSKRRYVEYDAYGSQSKKAKKEREKFNLMNDNDEKRRMLEHCQIKGKNILNPIIDWTEQEVWEFIKKYNLEYPVLYDEGWDRIGCIGCPLAKTNTQLKEFRRYPKYYFNYIKAFDRMIENRIKNDMDTEWKDGVEVMQWWLELKDEEFKIFHKEMLKEVL